MPAERRLREHSEVSLETFAGVVSDFAASSRGSRRYRPHSALIVFARDDDYFFGVLQSSVHELWSRRLGTQSGFRYTPTATFETFPLPEPTDLAREEVAAAAKSLDQLREGWLNPHGLTDDALRSRTLTNLYNERPSWLMHAHERLDRAVYVAYGWPYPLGNDDVLSRLVEVNFERAGEALAV